MYSPLLLIYIHKCLNVALFVGKVKYYNNCLLWNVQANYLVQTGDPTGTGMGGQSFFGLTSGDKRKDSFVDEINPNRRIDRAGLVCMANGGKENANRSQFFITLSNERLNHLEGKHTVFAEVAEGFDVLAKINELFCDAEGRPFQDVRIRHTFILDDPFPDPPDLIEPPSSPPPTRPPLETVAPRIPYEDDLNEGTDAKTQQELDESIRRKEAQSRAIVLEMTGDIPDAEAKPPVEVLFVCKLNPVTTDAELEIIFSRFGRIKQCEIIRDAKTGDSLNYAFIEFETEASCIEAYNKMNNVLIDDRRIKVDFSQSVSKLWNKFLLQPKGPKAKPASQQVPQLSRLTSKERPYRRDDHANNMHGGRSSLDKSLKRSTDRDEGSRGSRYEDRPPREDRHDRHTRDRSREGDRERRARRSRSREYSRSPIRRRSRSHDRGRRR